MRNRSSTPQYLRASVGEYVTTTLLLLLMSIASLMAGEYFEGFDLPGKPPVRDGIRWGYMDEITPVAGWKEIIPGDGYAHLTASAARLRKNLRNIRNGGDFLPFQTLTLGPVGSNHRISIRARNTAIPGVACVLFTYREKSKVDEIDIEITPDDTQGPITGHPTGTGGGWTDVRFNTWANARGETGESLRPRFSVGSPIIGSLGEKVSHRDDRFHLYTIEWRPESVRFFIDGIRQKVIDQVVPDNPSQIILGMRQMPWSGVPDWKGSQTMLIDWIDIEPLDREGKP